MFNDIYRGKTIFITGHTGFKGSWLTQWLLKLGAIVKGYSLYPFEEPSHFNLLHLESNQNLNNDYNDIRNLFELKKSIVNFQPDLVFHLAAQATVLDSYNFPKNTFDINIQGLVNLFEACKSVDSIIGIIVVTTDKVYQQTDNNYYFFRENDSLGDGYSDPYSASKVCCEILTNTYKKLIPNKLITTVRAGNVLGGGDFGRNRIVPDYIKARVNEKSFTLRNPEAIRPYQHVLDCLNGYLKVGEFFLNGDNISSLNFGPDSNSEIKNSKLIELLQFYLSNDVDFLWLSENKEANYLRLTSEKARKVLNWKPKYNIEQTVEKTMKWYNEWIATDNIITDQQIDEFMGN